MPDVRCKGSKNPAPVANTSHYDSLRTVDDNAANSPQEVDHT